MHLLVIECQFRRTYAPQKGHSTSRLRVKTGKGQRWGYWWYPLEASTPLHPSLYLSPSLPPFKPAASHSPPLPPPYEYKWRQFLVMNVSLGGGDATLVNNWRKMSEKLRSAVLMCLRLGSPAANHRQPSGGMETFPSHWRPHFSFHFQD